MSTSLRRLVLAVDGVDRAAHKDPERFFQLIGPQCAVIFLETAQLLVKREQIAQEQGCGLVGAGLVFQIEDAKVLAKTVAVEIAVGVVKEDGLAVLDGQCVVACGAKRLTKGGAVLKGEAAGAQRLAITAPRLTARTFVPFVHQDQVASLEGFHRHADAAAALLLHQFGDLDHLHHIAAGCPQSPGIQVETPRRYAGGGQIVQVLVAQPLVGRDEQDVIERIAIVVEKLADVEVQQQRLAAARRHPEGQLVQARRGERFVLHLAGQFGRIVRGDKRVQVGQQLARRVEQPVEHDLRIEHGQVLEVAQGDWLCPATVHGVEMRTDVVVIAGEHIFGDGNLCPAPQQMVDEIAAPICAKALLDIFRVLQQVAVVFVAE